ncbi:MAG: acyl-CoA dehydrogenase family protein [Deltaproteobacteria bacterium]|nr:acyl-CoA dehydrogenase family protein [Deltaproteobacteria bacterium]MBW2387569.1 acyl-CoA dehydrogenase family protein [Deltaproteobacteria bacterium]
MDLNFAEEYEEYRHKLQEFLKGWPLQGEEADLPLADQQQLFRQRGIEAGYVYFDIPKEYGGAGQEPDVFKSAIIADEYASSGAPGNGVDQGPGLLAPTLIEFGTEEQKRQFVLPTLRGEIRWCQGYSEPGAGSDLASLQCSALLDGDEWVINGQKIWTSNAMESQYLFGLFRTEPDVPRHGGISYLLVELDQPGIEVRPLKQMSGGMDFNEVFFTDARTPAHYIVGKRGEGWAVSRATLKHERNLIGNPNMMREHFDAAVALSRRTVRDGRPAIEDSIIRQRLAEIEGYVRTAEMSNLRQMTAASRGEEHKVMLPMMMNKLYSTDTMQMITGLAYELLGADGMLAPTEEDVASYARTHTSSGFVEQYIFSHGPAIAGGATNIQLNIIGERGLGLPRDLRSSK